MNAPLIRLYASGDEASIIDLYKGVFGLEMSHELWAWYYGHGAVIVVAEADGRIVGHYAVQPRPFHVDGEAVTAGLVIGSMVAPEFRNATTFISMAKLAYATCRERAIPFVYAFPNDNVWLVRRRMLEWKALPSLVSLVANAGSLAVSPVDSSVTALASRAPFPEMPWLERNDGTAVRAARSTALLDWRLRARPDLEYPVYVDRDEGGVRGYIALKHYIRDGHAEGHIIDLRVEPGYEATTTAKLLARAKQHFAAAAIDRITAWLLPASRVFADILHAGFVRGDDKGKNFGYLALDDRFESVLADAARWDVMMADSDVF